MKLILAIINKEDSTIVSQALTKARYSSIPTPYLDFS